MSGINILKNLLLKQAVKESGQASGIMSIGDSVRKLVERRLQSYLVSAANKGIDLDKFSESQIKYMLEMNNPYNKAKMQLRKEQGIKSADVLDMKGQKLDPNQPIIGGTQQTTSLDDEIKQAYNKAVKEGKLENVRLKDGRKIKSEEDFRNYIDELNEDNNLASGGRAGFKMGRRAFLKLLGGVGAGIGALKSGILKLAGKEAAPQVVKEVVEQTTKSTPPPYFFELANKIKTLGTPGKPTMARQEVHNYKNYELMEDKATGDIRITIEKGDPERIGGKDGYKQEVLEYKKGNVDVVDEGLETQKGVRTSDEYEEATIYPEPDTGRLKDVEGGVDENTIKEIIEEVNQEASKIKKAGGGIARVGYFLGSGRQAGTALIREILKYFNKDQKISVSEMLRTFNTRELRKLLDELSTYRKFDLKKSGMPAPQIIKDRIKKLNVGKEKVLENVLSAANAARRLDADMALRQNEMIEAAVEQGFSRQEAKELVEGMTTAIEKSAGSPPRFKTATDEGIMDIEMMLKDLKTQGDGRKLNSSGGIAGMLGE